MDGKEFREVPTVRIRPPRELLEKDRKEQREKPGRTEPEADDRNEQELLHRPPTLGGRQAL